MSRRTTLARLGVAAAVAVGATAGAAATAHADSGKALVEVNQLSNSAYAGVNPAALVSGLNHNPGAGAPFGVDAPNAIGQSATMSYAPPANTTITGWTAEVNNMFAYGWPAMSTFTEAYTSWGNFNINGNPGSIDQGGTYTGGAAASITAQVSQTSYGAGSPQPGRIYLSRLAVEQSDATPPSVDQAPAANKLFGDPDASGWYTAATLPLQIKASDVGMGVRWLLLKDGSTVHKYALLELTRLRGHSIAWAARSGQRGCLYAEDPSAVSAGVQAPGARARAVRHPVAAGRR